MNRLGGFGNRDFVGGWRPAHADRGAGGCEARRGGPGRRSRRLGAACRSSGGPRGSAAVRPRRGRWPIFIGLVGRIISLYPVVRGASLLGVHAGRPRCARAPADHRRGHGRLDCATVGAGPPIRGGRGPPGRPQFVIMVEIAGISTGNTRCRRRRNSPRMRNGPGTRASAERRALAAARSGQEDPRGAATQVPSGSPQAARCVLWRNGSVALERPGADPQRTSPSPQGRNLRTVSFPAHCRASGPESSVCAEWLGDQCRSITPGAPVGRRNHLFVQRERIRARAHGSTRDVAPAGTTGPKRSVHRAATSGEGRSRWHGVRAGTTLGPRTAGFGVPC